MYGMTEILKKTPDGVKPYRQIDDGEQWLADLVAKAKRQGSVVSEVCAISPSRAHALLARNPENRKLSDSLVATFAQDIAGNRWVFNGEPIIISDNGLLNDGQHRCAAVTTAQKTIEVLVVVGVPRRSRMTTDMGRVRTVGDFIGMNGVQSPNNVAAIAAMLMAIEAHGALKENGGHDNMGRKQRHTKSEVLGYARRNLEEIEKALKALDGKECQLVGTYSRLATALIVLARRAKSWSAPLEYITGIIDGANLKKKSPMHTVRERLLLEKRQGGSSAQRTIEILLRGWNAWRAGEQVLTRVTTTGNWPDVRR